MLPNIELESAHRRAEEWRQAVQEVFFSVEPIFIEECQGESALRSAGRIQVTVSIGIASFSPSGMKKEQVIDYADRALYRAKNDGRNRVEVYDAKSCVTR